MVTTKKERRELVVGESSERKIVIERDGGEERYQKERSSPSLTLAEIMNEPYDRSCSGRRAAQRARVPWNRISSISRAALVLCGVLEDKSFRVGNTTNGDVTTHKGKERRYLFLVGKEVTNTRNIQEREYENQG